MGGRRTKTKQGLPKPHPLDLKEHRLTTKKPSRKRGKRSLNAKSSVQKDAKRPKRIENLEDIVDPQFGEELEEDMKSEMPLSEEEMHGLEEEPLSEEELEALDDKEFPGNNLSDLEGLENDEFPQSTQAGELWDEAEEVDNEVEDDNFGNFRESEEEEEEEIDQEEEETEDKANFEDLDLDADPATMDPATLFQRIQHLAHLLSIKVWKNNKQHVPASTDNIKELEANCDETEIEKPKEAEKQLSRSALLSHFLALLCPYYSLSPFLAEHFTQLFSPSELLSFLDASSTPRPISIRTNTLLTNRRTLTNKLISRGVQLSTVPWTKFGLTIHNSQVPVGATPEYMAGHYILQSPSSWLPVISLNIQPTKDMRVLDMCASPGGKTTHIASLLKNTGVVFANEYSKTRLNSLVANIHRLNIQNAVVSNCDGRVFGKIYKNTFDRVLLDAPCTGTGVMSKDETIKQKEEKDFKDLAQTQRELLLSGIDALKVGGIIVYSTCSVSPLENEAVVSYALEKRHVKLMEIDGEIPGEKGLSRWRGKRWDGMEKTRRIYPHKLNMNGFYWAKLMKVANIKDVKAENGVKKEEK